MHMLTRRLQILLDDGRYRRLASVARRRKVSVSTVVRDAIDRDLAGPDRRRHEAGKRILAATPMPIGDVDEMLAELDALRSRHG